MLVHECVLWQHQHTSGLSEWIFEVHDLAASRNRRPHAWSVVQRDTVSFQHEQALPSPHTPSGLMLKRITMFLRWVRTHPMPGIGCPVKFYIRCPGNWKIGISGNPEIRIFGDSEPRESENLDFRIPGNPDFGKSDF